MQTLEPRNTYTPTNAPQVRCSCDSSLNRGEAVEETLSVPGLKTSSNNSDVGKAVDLLVSESSRTRTCEYLVKKTFQPIRQWCSLPLDPTI